jgi:hypothetical protein
LAVPSLAVLSSLVAVPSLAVLSSLGAVPSLAVLSSLGALSSGVVLLAPLSQEPLPEGQRYLHAKYQFQRLWGNKPDIFLSGNILHRFCKRAFANDLLIS